MAIVGKFAVIGQLADFDVIFAEHLRRWGHDATVLRSERKRKRGDRNFAGRDKIVYWQSPSDLLRKVRKFEFVFTFTAAFSFGLRQYFPFYPIFRRAGWPPYMNIATGSDVTERAIEKSLAGFWQRLSFHYAFTNMITNYPAAIDNAIRLRLRNACILPFPYFPAQPTANRAPIIRLTEGEFLILHPSHLDWGVTDSGEHRNSKKGNDRFLRALSRFIRETSQAVRVVMLDRGSDRIVARQEIEKLGLTGIVEWHAGMSRDELFGAMSEADLVVDQFDVGGLGGIAWEAMSLGRLVMIYLASPNDLLSYDEEIPVLNARTEVEILEMLHRAADKSWREARIANVRTWMAPRDPARFVPRYLFYASLATGRDLGGFCEGSPVYYATSSDAHSRND